MMLYNHYVIFCIYPRCISSNMIFFSVTFVSVDIKTALFGAVVASFMPLTDVEKRGFLFLFVKYSPKSIKLYYNVWIVGVSN
jgi:hypothetical protein